MNPTGYPPCSAPTRVANAGDGGGWVSVSVFVGLVGLEGVVGHRQWDTALRIVSWVQHL